MICKNLIAVLETFDPEIEVMINGYEGGLERVHQIRGTKVSWSCWEKGFDTEDWDKWVKKHDSYFGPYEEDKSGTKEIILIERLT